MDRFHSDIKLTQEAKRVRQPIEPTDIEIGERLFILLDPNGATAELVEVLPAWNEMNC